MPFIVFEGLDGSGKSSLISAFEGALQKQSIPFIRTREPGGTPLGEELRQIILRTNGEAPCPRTELLLYEAIRAQHVEKVIQPALAKGLWVLCDRFAASSIAFQAGGREIKEEEVVQLNTFATKGLEADLTVLLDLPVEVSQQRIHGRNHQTGEGVDRIELEKKDFHERVRNSFLQQSQGQKKWLVLNSQNTTDSMLAKLLERARSEGWLSSLVP
jgi:dTMP kinase